MYAAFNSATSAIKLRHHHHEYWLKISADFELPKIAHWVLFEYGPKFNWFQIRDAKLRTRGNKRPISKGFRMCVCFFLEIEECILISHLCVGERDAITVNTDWPHQISRQRRKVRKTGQFQFVGLVKNKTKPDRHQTFGWPVWSFQCALLMNESADVASTLIATY